MTESAPGSAGARLRLFFAAVPDAAARERIAALSQSMPLQPGARRVLRDNYHMTLAFVGDIAVSQLPLLLQVGAAQKERAFSVALDAREYWPKSGVVVAAVRLIPAELHRLWRRLHDDLAGHTRVLESEPLRPHITLARKVSQPPVLQAMSAFDWRVRDFCLMRSDTSGIQSAYTVVDTWPLLDSVENA
jgi:2'-5' RNA ligase